MIIRTRMRSKYAQYKLLNRLNTMGEFKQS